MVDMAVIYGADRSRAERELMDSLNFEIALANVSEMSFFYFQIKINARQLASIWTSESIDSE